MKILQYECESVKYKPVEKSNSAEKLEAICEVELSNVTTLFISIQKRDTLNLFKQMFKNIKLNYDNILIYPYAHLSKNLETPSNSFSLIKQIEEFLKSLKLFVTRAPFGWIKQIELKSNGLTESFYDSDELEATIVNPESVKSQYMFTNDDLEPISLSSASLKDKLNYNLLTKSDETNIIEYSEDKLLASKIYFHSTLADSGHPLYTIEGAYLFQRIYDIALLHFQKSKYVGIKTPTIWSTKYTIFKNYLNKFPGRQYIIKQKEEDLVLRFACCFGAMEYFKKDYYTYYDLPIGFYEIGEVFRNEQKGEVMGIRRPRKFTMTDLHVICNDLWVDEIIYCLDLIHKNLNDLYLLDDIVFIMRYQKDFNKDVLRKICKKMSQDFGITSIFHHVLETQEAYWAFKLEFAINVKNDLVQLSTVQVDTWNGEHCDLSYYNTKTNEKERPVIIHCSPIGSIDRVVYVLMHKPIPYNLRKIQLVLLDFNKQLPRAEITELNRLKGTYEIIDVEKNTFSKIIKKLRQSLVPYYIVYGYAEKQGKNVELQTTLGEIEASFKSISDLITYLNKK